MSENETKRTTALRRSRRSTNETTKSNNELAAEQQNQRTNEIRCLLFISRATVCDPNEKPPRTVGVVSRSMQLMRNIIRRCRYDLKKIPNRRRFEENVSLSLSLSMKPNLCLLYRVTQRVLRLCRRRSRGRSLTTEQLHDAEPARQSQ
jgi:hypothetical protein